MFPLIMMDCVAHFPNRGALPTLLNMDDVVTISVTYFLVCFYDDIHLLYFRLCHVRLVILKEMSWFTVYGELIIYL